MSLEAFPGFMALCVEEVFDTSSGRIASHRLLSKKTDGLFLTDVWLHVGIEDNELRAKIVFQAEGPHLPYNVYALMIATDDDVLICKSFAFLGGNVPLSLFAGREFALKPVAVPSAKFNARLIVWGR